MHPLRAALGVALLLLAGCAQPASPPTAPALTCLACPTVVAQGDAGAYWEPHVAVDPNDPDHVVAAVVLLRRDPTAAGADLYGDDMLVARSRDGGATWALAQVPHGPSAADGHPLRTAFALADPNVAFLPDGTPLVSGLGYAYAVAGVAAYGQGFRAWIARLPSEGTAADPVDVTVVAQSSGVASQGALGNRGALADNPDAPTIAVAPDGVVHMSFRRITQATPAQAERSVMVATRSSDGGRTWAPEVTVPLPGNGVASQLVALRDGTLLAAVGGWDAGGVAEAATGSQLVARSVDGGASWTVAQLDDEHLPSYAWWPMLAESDAGVHAAWAASGPDGHERLLLANSTDGGASFTAPVELAVAPGVGAMLPTLGGDGRRTVLTWFEPRPDGTNRLLGRSLDARGLSAPVTLDATLHEDATTLGEYFGAAVHGQTAWTVWTANDPAGQLRVAAVHLS